MRSFPLADYEQRVPIRIGSLSQCFSAQHRGSGDGGEVLLKQLLPAFARVPGIATAWLDRAEENSRFDHPGCFKVLDWGETLGESYLTLPTVAALSLRELLQAASKSGRWPSAQAVAAIAQGALSALAYVHSGFGLVHLDLDPHAVLLRRDGSVLLTEFGMWRALPPEAATRERFDRGRVAYLCPELTKSLEGDARSDVFSLGAILYELLGKQRPFQGTTQLVTAMAIAEGRRRPLSELAPDAPEMLRDIVETMLAQRPDERFQSAQAVLGALSSCCEVDAQAAASWFQSVGGQGASVREKRPSGPSAAVQVADAAARAGLAGTPGPLSDPRAVAMPPLFAQPGVERTGSSPLPPPLFSPSGPGSALEAGAHVRDVPPADDFLAPPPMLGLGPSTPVASAIGPGDAGAPQVRDGRTAFIDTGAARKGLAQASAALSAPREPAFVDQPPPRVRFADMVTRDSPAVSNSGLPPRSDPLSAPPLAPLKPMAALPPPAISSKAMLPSLPPLEFDSPGSGSAERRGWQEPSKTVFQVKAFAKQATRRTHARAPLLVIVVLSVAFGFAVVAGVALLWRLLTA